MNDKFTTLEAKKNRAFVFFSMAGLVLHRCTMLGMIVIFRKKIRLFNYMLSILPTDDHVDSDLIIIYDSPYKLKKELYARLVATSTIKGQ